MSNEKYKPRELENLVRRYLEKRAAVQIDGARQVGKSTLAKRICEERNGEYLTLEDADVKHTLRTRPAALLSMAKSKMMVIDEVQSLPGLVRTVKQFIDERERPGMFVLTGSGDRTRKSSDYKPLTGRAKSLSMRPMSQLEIDGLVNAGIDPGAGDNEGGDETRQGSRNFTECLFAGESPGNGRCDGLHERLKLGGYPRSVLTPDDKARIMEEYVEAELVNNYFRISRNEAISSVPKLIEQLAKMQGRISNVKLLSEKIESSQQATRKLIDLLSNTFVMEPLTALQEKFRNRQLAKKYKIYLNDSGLVTTMLGLDGCELTDEHLGTLLEVFVLSELRKSLACSSLSSLCDIHYYREQTGIEVDFVIKNGVLGEIVAIEVKAASNYNWDDWDNLREFKEIAKGKCKRCILLYGGHETVVLEEGIEAWPISCLWAWG